MKPHLLLIVVVLAALSAQPAAGAGPAAVPATSAERYLAAGREHQAAGRFEEARGAFLRVLERDPGSLEALAGLVDAARGREDADEETFYLHAYVDRAERLGAFGPGAAPRLKEFKRDLRIKDWFFGKVEGYRKSHLAGLIALGEEHLRKGGFHQAKMVFEEVAHVDPDSAEAREALKRILAEGGNELAAARVQGEEELFSDVTAEWITKQNERHSTWDRAWEEKIEGYTVLTDAGYDVLKVTATALGQLDNFYRIFYRYKEKGGSTPHIQVRIYKDRAEFMELGRPHVEWAGGYYNGSAVVTYDPRGSQDSTDGRAGMEPSRSLQGLIQTVAHEVSHHFVAIAAGGGVPAWLNEGLATFFEGTTLLSNGRVDWNLVAPHRLFPLLELMDKPGSYNLANVIACRVEDYRIFYPVGWGLVYFLYNYENEEGEYVYRDVLHEYVASYVGGIDHLDRFEEYIIKKPRVAGIGTLAEFEAAYVKFMRALKDEYLGKAEVGRRYEQKADECLAKGDMEKARLFYEKADKKIPDDPEILWKFAGLLETLGEKDHAAGRYRQFINASEFRGVGADPRLAEARERIGKLDPLAGRFKKLREQFEEDVLAVAEGYRDQGLFLMALATARDLAVADNPSILARVFYLDVGEASGKTLEHWEAAFNGDDLDGWWGDELTGQFLFEEGLLVGTVKDEDVEGFQKAPLTGGVKAAPEQMISYKTFFHGGGMLGDFSLEAEMRAPAGCELYGICLGRRSNDFFQGVLLKSDGNLDVSTFDSAWFIRRHVPAPVDRKEWHRLRVDVRGNLLKVFMNDRLLEELEYDNPAELRGEAGILVGRGRAEFREVRVLHRNWRLPHRRIKREFDAASAAGAGLARAEPGSSTYRGRRPPELVVQGWRNREPATLDQLLGKVVVLAFWSTYQEAAVPALPFFAKLTQAYEGLDVELVVVTNDKPAELDLYLEKRRVPHGMAVDLRDRTFKNYAIPETGLPHVKLLDLDGVVVWEGNPDWSEKHGSYVDQPLAELSKALRLPEIAALKPKLPGALAAIDAGRFAEAYEVLEALEEFSGMNASHPAVREGLAGLARLTEGASATFALAAARAEAGNRLGAVELLRQLKADYPFSPEAVLADAELENLEKDALYRDCLWIEHRVTSALEAGAGGDAARFEEMLDRVEERLARVLAGGMNGVRGIEYRFILDWLTNGRQERERFAGTLASYREIRLGIEKAEALAASTRRDEARRLAAEVAVLAEGTPLEQEALAVLAR